MPARRWATPGAYLVMNITYLAIATLAHVLIVAFAGSFQKALTDPRRELIVRRVFAVALASIAIWFAVTSGRPAA